MKINDFLKSDNFKNVMAEFNSVKDYAAEDYKLQIDEVVGIDPYDGRDEKVIKLISNMTLSYNMKKIDFQELMLLLFRLSTSFIHVF